MRARTGGRVLEHEHPHARGDDAGHRPDGAAVVAGLEAHRGAAREERRCVLGVVDQTLERGAAHQRAAQRSGRAVPGDRRAGVQELAGARARAPRAPVRRRPAAPARPASAPAPGRWPPRAAGSSATVARSSSVPGNGGRQSTRVTSAAWLATASASRSTPTLTTRHRGCLRGARARGGWRRRWTGGPRRRRRRARRPGGRGPAGRGRCRRRRPRPVDARPRAAGASEAAGSSSAPWPSTTSSRITPVSGSAATSASRSRRRLGSIIGWARPSV